jgi:hypothetical protein
MPIAPLPHSPGCTCHVQELRARLAEVVIAIAQLNKPIGAERFARLEKPHIYSRS